MPKSKVNDILNLPYNELVNLTRKENTDELRSNIKRLILAANRRINILTSNDVGIYSPAYQTLVKSGIKKFTTKNLNTMSTNDLMHQFSRVKKFMTAQSSTLAGWNKIRSNIATRTGAKKLFNNSYKTARSATLWHNREQKFWKMYNELVDNYGGIITQLDSNRIQAMLYKVQSMQNRTRQGYDVSEIMNNYITKLYESANTGEVLKDAEILESEFNIKL